MTLNIVTGMVFRDFFLAMIYVSFLFQFLVSEQKYVHLNRDVKSRLNVYLAALKGAILNLLKGHRPDVLNWRKARAILCNQSEITH